MPHTLIIALKLQNNLGIKTLKHDQKICMKSVDQYTVIAGLVITITIDFTISFQSEREDLIANESAACYADSFFIRFILDCQHCAAQPGLIERYQPHSVPLRVIYDLIHLEIEPTDIASSSMHQTVCRNDANVKPSLKRRNATHMATYRQTTTDCSVAVGYRGYT